MHKRFSWPGIGLAVGLVLALTACPSNNGVDQIEFIEVSPEGQSVSVGKTKSFRAVAKNANGQTMSGVRFSWESSDTGVATVSDAGLAKGIAVGAAVIRAYAVGSYADPGETTLEVLGASPTPPPPTPPTPPPPPPTPPPTPPTPPPPPATVSGSISAPTGQTLTSVRVIACPVINGTYDCSNSATKLVSIPDGGSSANYSLTGLNSNTVYAVFGSRDVNGNGAIRDNGDWWGCVGDGAGNCVGVSSPASGKNIALQILGGGTTPPPPPPPPGNGVVAGTIDAPTGQTFQGVFVVACPVTGTSFDCASANAKSIAVPNGGSSSPYSISGLQDGTNYVVVGYRDVNNNGRIRDDGDWWGCVGSGGDNCSVVVSPATGKNVALRVLGAGSGGGTGTLSGTLYAPTGGNLQDTFFMLCGIVAGSDGCDPARTVRVTVSSNAASVPFEFQNANGDYMLLAWKDVNGNGNIDAGDYTGCYGGTNLNNCQTVSPPKTALDVRLSVVAGLAGLALQDGFSQAFGSWLKNR